MPLLNPLDDFGLRASLGWETGVSTINKFGEATDCDSGVPTDIWDGADGATSTDIWVPPNAARVHAMVSTSNTDSDSGGVNPQAAGARTVRVYGLQTWDTAETSEDVVLDGTTAVNTASSYVIIYRVKVLTWGANGVNAGIITATAATDATITAMILAGNNQTQMCIFAVPSIQKLRITKVMASIVKSTGSTQRADGELLVMTDPATNAASNTAWTNKENFQLVEANTPWEHDYRDTPKKCDGPCIVKIQVTTNANDTKAIGTIDGFIVDN